MVDWLAGKRMKGTSSERTSLSTTALGGTGVGGWVELARTSASGSSTSYDVTSLPDKRYYMVLSNFWITSGNGNPYFRLNGDTGSNYSARYSMNGAADGTMTSTDRGMYGGVSGYNLLPYFTVDYFANVSSKEKLHIGHVAHQNTAGAGNAPNRAERHLKHAQTSNPITQYNMWNQSGSGNFSSSSETVVLGWDPADTHTTNFWQELASVELTSASSTIDTGTFTAKKYLWVQVYFKSGGGSIDTYLRANGDTGANYACSESINGASDTARTSGAIFFGRPGYGFVGDMFCNHFIINNASNEKLCISHFSIRDGTGATVAPARAEVASKWANTSNQITRLEVADNGGGTDYDTGSIIKVWGAD